MITTHITYQQPTRCVTGILVPSSGTTAVATVSFGPGNATDATCTGIHTGADQEAGVSVSA
ncbi:hypothetical protein B0H10DRAFT_2008203 [Mycena sp. CBHHK59/15]|nr:hypothetical protein B0H10DRAFT_2008203 [Mycena sp. CBHHK59/15]